MPYPGSFSPDDRELLFEHSTLETGSDLWVVSMDGTAPEPFLASPRVRRGRGILTRWQVGGVRLRRERPPRSVRALVPWQGRTPADLGRRGRVADLVAGIRTTSTSARVDA